jgi:hypothetical protein
MHLNNEILLLSFQKMIVWRKTDRTWLWCSPSVNSPPMDMGGDAHSNTGGPDGWWWGQWDQINVPQKWTFHLKCTARFDDGYVSRDLFIQLKIPIQAWTEGLTRFIFFEFIYALLIGLMIHTIEWKSINYQTNIIIPIQLPILLMYHIQISFWHNESYK